MTPIDGLAEALLEIVEALKLHPGARMTRPEDEECAECGEGARVNGWTLCAGCLDAADDNEGINGDVPEGDEA